MTLTTRPLIIFDLDGTLAETAEDILASVNHVTAPYGVEPLTMSEHRALVGFGGRHLIKEAFKGTKRALNAADLEILFLDFIVRYEANVAQHSILFPGVLANLQQLQREGYDLAICTNKSSGPCRSLLEALQIHHLFCTVVANDTFSWSKPDPRVLLATIEMAHAHKACAIMVGDSRTDIDAARAAGIPVIAVDFGYSDVPLTDLKPDEIVSDFDALPKAIRTLIKAA